MIPELKTTRPQVHAEADARVTWPRLEVLSETRRPRLVAILPRGEAIRNFVYTGALDEAARETDVSLISVIPNDEMADLLCSRYQRVFPLEKIPDRRFVRNLREIQDMAHGRWLWSAAAQERWRLRELEAYTASLKLKRLVKKLACYPFANRLGLRMLTSMERVSSRMLRTTDDYLNIFKRLNPSLVFNGSHVHGELALHAVHAAQWLGIPTAAFIFSWDNLTSQGRIMPPYDYYLVWNESIRKQLLQMYDTVSPERVFVTGTPQFDFHFRREFHWSREEFCHRVGADPQRPIVLYATGMANHMPGEPEIVEGIANVFEQMVDLGPPQLLVRIYPKDQTGRFAELKKRRPDILFPTVPWEPAWLTPKEEDSPLLTNMLRHAAAGINIASTISLELCMLDKPVVNVGYNCSESDRNNIDFARYYEFDHYKPLVDEGAVKLANSQEELRVFVREALTQPQADSQKRSAFMKKMFGRTLDGYSGLRVAHRLTNLAWAHFSKTSPQN